MPPDHSRYELYVNALATRNDLMITLFLLAWLGVLALWGLAKVRRIRPFIDLIGLGGFYATLALVVGLLIART